MNRKEKKRIRRRTTRTPRRRLWHVPAHWVDVDFWETEMRIMAYMKMTNGSMFYVGAHPDT